MKAVPRLIASVALAASAGATLAGGFVCGPIVTDPANVAQNTIAAVQSVQSYAQRVTAYKKQLDQLLAAKNQVQGVVSSVKVAQSTAQELARVQKLSAAVSQLYGSSTQLKEVFQRRLQAAKAAGTSIDDYLAAEQERINRNVKGAVDTAAEEQRILAQVQRDYEYTREMSTQIRASKGMEGDAQNMARLVDRMIVQQAEFQRAVAPTAVATGDVLEAAKQKAAKRQYLLERDKDLSETARQVRDAEARATRDLRGQQP